MADPQKPDPNAPWCPKCEGHTETEWVQAGDSGRNVHQCVSCGWTAFEVGKLKAKTSAAATNIFFLTLILFPILVVVGIVTGNWYGSLAGLVAVSFLALFIYHFTVRQPAKIRERWLVWAKERGWEGE